MTSLSLNSSYLETCLTIILKPCFDVETTSLYQSLDHGGCTIPAASTFTPSAVLIACTSMHSASQPMPNDPQIVGLFADT